MKSVQSAGAELLCEIKEFFRFQFKGECSHHVRVLLLDSTCHDASLVYNAYVSFGIELL